MKKNILYPVSILVAFLHVEGNREINAQRLSREFNVDVLVNHVGYIPTAEKTCLMKGTLNQKFDVIDLRTQKVVYSGILKPETSDFGTYSIGDFSEVREEGHYYIRSDTLRSFPFAVSSRVYREPIDLIRQYFSRQRCGSSPTGYLSPCHIDDGIRIDNGKHQQVTGGWHDASDLRKWVGATIYGMIGLGKIYEFPGATDGNKEKILDELRWGNQYFLNMQEPQGYVMSFIGGDVKKHSDSNRWTDNETGDDGGELLMVKPTTGKSSHDMLIFTGKDDRVIETKPLDIIGQFNFVTAEAIMARITKNSDPAYASKCLDAATKCFNWSTKTNKEAGPGVAGASMQAALEMYKTTKQDIYRTFAIEQAALLTRLQAKAAEGGIRGFFFTSLSGQEPHKDIWHGCQEFIAMCDLIQAFPSDQAAKSWKQVITSYAKEYLQAMSQKNSFGIIPFGLYSKQDPGGNRRAGKYWYRYFMEPDPTWWVGINSNLASGGVGLLKAARILNDPKLEAVAQNQLDWILGVNPFNSATMVGVGHNHPKHFGGSTFSPLTPILPGAVMNGLGGDQTDQTIIGNGNWQISEYWTPMVAYTMWLMAELSETR